MAPALKTLSITTATTLQPQSAITPLPIVLRWELKACLEQYKLTIAQPLKGWQPHEKDNFLFFKHARQCCRFVAGARYPSQHLVLR
jgi:hypothetical protein